MEILDEYLAPNFIHLVAGYQYGPIGRLNAAFNNGDLYAIKLMLKYDANLEQLLIASTNTENLTAFKWLYQQAAAIDFNGVNLFVVIAKMMLDCNTDAGEWLLEKLKPICSRKQFNEYVGCMIDEATENNCHGFASHIEQLYP